MMDTLLQDLRFAVRSLLRSPGFSAVVVVTLALGIGANSAIFTVLDRALLRPLPVHEPERLFHVYVQRGPDNLTSNFSYPKMQAISGVEAFSGAFAHQFISLALRVGSDASRIEAAGVSAGFFDVLGIAPAHGRGFLPGEDRVGTGANVVVLSDALWRRRFDADRAIVGRTVVLNGRSFEVIGIGPRGFAGMSRGSNEDVWIPLGVSMELEGLADRTQRWRSTWLNIFARVAPGFTQASADDALAALDRGLTAQGNQDADHRTHLREGGRGMSWMVSSYEKPLTILMIVVAGVLLIACANVANLLLARASARSREVAVRLSLGASRSRLTRQLLTESLVIALAGGAAGLLVAGWLQDVLLAFRPEGGETFVLPTAPDGRVLLFTLGLTVLTGVLFGLLPSMRASRHELVGTLKDGTPGSSASRGLGVRGLLVISQVALSLVLLVGTSLFLRSLRNLQSVDLGFEPTASVMVAGIDLRQAGYDQVRGLAFTRALLERVSTLPGVSSASITRIVPPTPGGENWGGAQLVGSPVPQAQVSFDVNVVAPAYFETMGIELKRGRGITVADREDAPLVAVVNEAMAARYWPGRDPIGQQISMSNTSAGPPYAEVVGVARDGRYRGVRASGEAMVYFPLAQQYRPQLNLLVRARRGAPDLLAVQREVHALDAGLPLANVRSLRQQAAIAMGRDRMIATLVLMFGALALGLAALGLFGVMAFDTNRRTREIGVRMALGARPADVLGQVAARGVRLVAAGMVIGALVAFGVSRYASSMLYEVTPADPAAYLLAAGALSLAAALATWLPARRAARVDPMVALRND